MSVQWFDSESDAGGRQLDASPVSAKTVLLIESPRALCDHCLTEMLGLPYAEVAAQTASLASENRFQRRVGRCARCRSTRRQVSRYQSR